MSTHIPDDSMSANVDSESEWEYEYSTTETEDLYVVIDMPQSAFVKDGRLPNKEPSMFVDLKDVRSARKKRKQVQRHKTRRRRKRNPETGELEPLPGLPADADEEDGNDQVIDDDDDDDDDGNTELNEDEDEQSQQQDDATVQDTEKDDDQEASSLQLVKLGSYNPLLHYKDRLFQLHWADGLGTDMYFVKRDEDEQPREGVLRSFGRWDLLGCSGARLVASETKVRYKGYGNIISGQRHSGNPIQAVGSSAQRQPFLRRLVDLQVQKGEIKREDIIFPEERSNKDPTNGSNLNLQDRISYNMIMGQVEENDDGDPFVVATKRKTKRRRRTQAELQEDASRQSGRSSRTTGSEELDEDEVSS